MSGLDNTVGDSQSVLLIMGSLRLIVSALSAGKDECSVGVGDIYWTLVCAAADAEGEAACADSRTPGSGLTCLETISRSVPHNQWTFRLNTQCKKKFGCMVSKWSAHLESVWT